MILVQTIRKGTVFQGVLINLPTSMMRDKDLFVAHMEPRSVCVFSFPSWFMAARDFRFHLGFLESSKSQHSEQDCKLAIAACINCLFSRTCFFPNYTRIAFHVFHEANT